MNTDEIEGTYVMKYMCMCMHAHINELYMYVGTFLFPGIDM